jgi:histidinol phosphatase-like PHP family hydrolase
MNRRHFLWLTAALSASAADDSIPVVDGVPRVDFHAHVGEGVTLEAALEISKKRGVKLGVLQHGGVNEGMSNDDELRAWTRSLDGKPVFKGMQAEGLNWMSAFSKKAVSELDYVLSDALTIPDKSGALVKIYVPEFRCANAQEFMDRYIDFHLEVMEKEPLDILANATFLPIVLQPQFETLWTVRRMRTVIDAAVKHRVAIEINSRYRVPRLRFLEMAKAAGAEFSFGSNEHGAEKIGNIDYCVEMYRKLNLTLANFFHVKDRAIRAD